jgi:His/Glu/Gln/Arg/opine family amino acid ABC transporter permease subunit
MTPIFDLNLLLTGTYHDWLLAGLITSLSLTGISLALALPLAIIIALVRLSPVKLLQWSGFAFVEAIRNVPLLAHMLFWYFGAPELLPTALREWLYARNVEATSAIIALTLYTAAYMSEDVPQWHPLDSWPAVRGGARARFQFRRQHATGGAAAGTARHDSAADFADAQPLEGHQHRHRHRCRRTDVSGSQGGKRHVSAALRLWPLPRPAISACRS